MIRTLLLAVLTLATPTLAADPPALAPSEIVAAAPRTDWIAIPASDLLVMDLAPGLNGKPRRVVIQLMPPPFSQGWIGNIRKLAAAHWWDGLSINRVQDNYVVQWGDADGEDKAKARRLPNGLATMPEADYVVEVDDHEELRKTATRFMLRTMEEEIADEFVERGSPFDGTEQTRSLDDNFYRGWPLSLETERPGSSGQMAPIHCYSMVGVGRDLPPNTGSGAELYTVIGHAPRHLDRNIALVGRVIEGIEHLSSLTRGTGALGFYETPEERTTITAIRLGSEVAALPAYEYLSTTSETFARYADARANRREPFFIKPAGGADICNIPVPVRRAK